MNPRGRQYALGHTLEGWTRLSHPSPRQRRLLRLAYRGWLPFVYSRYGTRQWAAPLPGTRLVVKDPFALLSIPTVVEVTGATAVLVYRHPGAVLASYRRMSWTPQLGEIASVVNVDPPTSIDATVDPVVGEMARFWTALNRVALSDVLDTPGAIVVSHEAVTAGGHATVAAVAAACGLTLATDPGERNPLAVTSAAVAEDFGANRLHNFNRAPDEAAHGWRAKISDAELAVLEEHAGPTLESLGTAAMRHRPVPEQP